MISFCSVADIADFRSLGNLGAFIGIVRVIYATVLAVEFRCYFFFLGGSRLGSRLLIFLLLLLQKKAVTILFLMLFTAVCAYRMIFCGMYLHATDIARLMLVACMFGRIAEWASWCYGTFFVGLLMLVVAILAGRVSVFGMFFTLAYCTYSLHAFLRRMEHGVAFLTGHVFEYLVVFTAVSARIGTIAFHMYEASAIYANRVYLMSGLTANTAGRIFSARTADMIVEAADCAYRMCSVGIEAAHGAYSFRGFLLLSAGHGDDTHKYTCYREYKRQYFFHYDKLLYLFIFIAQLAGDVR